MVCNALKLAERLLLSTENVNDFNELAKTKTLSQGKESFFSSIQVETLVAAEHGLQPVLVINKTACFHQLIELVDIICFIQEFFSKRLKP